MDLQNLVPNETNEKWKTKSRESNDVARIESIPPPSSFNSTASKAFLVFSFLIGMGGCLAGHDDPKVVGGDAYNYIIGAERGTAIVGVAVVFALIGVALAIYDLTSLIIYYNKSKN